MTIPTGALLLPTLTRWVERTTTLFFHKALFLVFAPVFNSLKFKKDFFYETTYNKIYTDPGAGNDAGNGSYIVQEVPGRKTGIEPYTGLLQQRTRFEFAHHRLICICTGKA